MWSVEQPTDNNDTDGAVTDEVYNIPRTDNSWLGSFRQGKKLLYFQGKANFVFYVHPSFKYLHLQRRIPIILNTRKNQNIDIYFEETIKMVCFK